MKKSVQRLLQYFLQERHVDSKGEYARVFKVYDRGERVYGDEKGEMASMLASLSDIALERKSANNFTGAELQKEDIATMLSHALAGKGERHMYASGGALYPINLYYLSQEKRGDVYAYTLFFFDIREKSLVTIKKWKSKKTIKEVIGTMYNIGEKASGAFFFTYMPEKNYEKYQMLGMRLALIEVGEMLQMLYLACAFTKGKIGLRALAGFSHEKIDTLLDIDSLSEMSILVAVIGVEGGK
jgi:SagB-type dehydrogenase family enzyme